MKTNTLKKDIVMKILYHLLILISLAQSVSAFEFTLEPIDAVIPCHAKDIGTIDLVIEGIRNNVHNIRRIIVVSAEPLTNNAEWFDEKNFPFTKKTVAFEIFKDEHAAQQFMQHPKTRIGWIYQQILKSYAIFVIPNISSNILIVDADTIFLKPVTFQDPKTGAGLYNPGTENHHVYFDHLKRVLPGFRKVFPEYSGISHHMLFQRSVMEALFADIRNAHNKEPWKVFCEQIDQKELFGSCMCIEYELYFNYVFAHTDAVKIRHLKWNNVLFSKFQKHLPFYKKEYDYASCHSWMT